MVIVVLLCVIVAGVASTPAAPLDRADALAARLRCPVCQGLSVAESRSETALAMQDRIDQMVATGATNTEVEAFFIDRYGTWVVLDPEPSGFGVVLWAFPAVAVAVGVIAILRRRRRPGATDQPVDPDLREAVRDQVAAMHLAEDDTS